MKQPGKRRLVPDFLFVILLGQLLFLSACKNEKKQTYVFQISGALNNFSADKILLKERKSLTGENLLYATEKEGKFYMQAIKKYPVNQYYIQVDTFSYRIPVLIDNSDINLFLAPDDLKKSYTSGSTEFQQIFSQYQLETKNKNDLFSIQKKYVEANKNSLLGAIFLREMLGKTKWRLNQTKTLYEQLDAAVQNSPIGIEINHYITENLKSVAKQNMVKKTPAKEKEKRKSALHNTISDKEKNNTVSEYAPYFFAMGTENIDLDAKTIFAKNKLTLIDFWASWCTPCRAQTPDLQRLYNEYHTKGFEILSVSEDKKKEAWLQAISQDKMHWVHVIDDYKRVANMYHVKTIPYAILVDNQGGIIEKHIGINRLESALKNLLK